jgi:FtsP/CotA-like multicopper oxidase with cupredoxin domain
MSRNQRLSFLGIAAVIVVIAIVVFAASGGPDETAEDAASPAAGQTSTPTSSGTPASGDRSTATPTATAKPQAPLLESGKVAKLRYTEGDTVTFRVVSEKAEEVHVHGYDIKKELEAGKPATMSFKASITGIFEIEFEGSAEQIAELRVDPE